MKTPAPKSRRWSRALGLLRRKKSWRQKDGVYTWQGYGWGVDPPPRTRIEKSPSRSAASMLESV